MLQTIGNCSMQTFSRVLTKASSYHPPELRTSVLQRVPRRVQPNRSLSLNTKSTTNYKPRRSRHLEGVRCEVSATPISQPSAEDSTETDTPARFSQAAAKQLSKATRALRAYGWFGFWSQLSLGITSGIVLLFSIAFTAQAGPSFALYLTALGVSATFLACFQYFGMIRTSRRMRDYLEAPPGVTIKKISKEMVVNSISQTLATAVAGLACTVLALQASVGLLLAKTLTNASANPFVVGSQGTWNPVLAFDVFLLQSSVNTVLSHTIGAMISLWLLIKLRDRTLWEALFGVTKSSS